jgi:hypothetical protein
MLLQQLDVSLCVWLRFPLFRFGHLFLLEAVWFHNTLGLPIKRSERAAHSPKQMQGLDLERLDGSGAAQPP